MEKTVWMENGELKLRKDISYAMRKLMAYENTGVSPVEAMVLRKENEAMREHIRGLDGTVYDLCREIEGLRAELEDERYRHDRLQDFEVAEAQEMQLLKKACRAVKELMGALVE